MADGASFRVYQLAVGNEATEIDGTNHNKNISMSYVDKLQFTADINYTTDKSKVSSDETTIEIYNLNTEYEQKFKTQGATILLRAGYDTQFTRDSNGDIQVDYDSLPVIYLGTILHAYTVKRGVDKVTRVFCTNDGLERDIKKTSVSYSPGTKKSDVIKDLVSRFGMSVAELDLSSLGDSSYPSGLSVYGSISNTLNRVCQENGLMWFTQNKQLRIVPVDAAPKNLAWEIYPFQIINSVEGYYRRTQTLSQPKKKATQSRGKKSGTKAKALPEDTTVSTVTNADGSKLKTKIKTGLRLKTFLDGRIKLGDNVIIKGSDEYLTQVSKANGQFRIISIKHTLDFRGGEWSTEFNMVSAMEADK